MNASQVGQIAQRIVERFDPERIVLFGSHARGDAGPDSDLDLFIEMESSKPPPQRAVQISSIFGLRRWPLDLVVYTPEEVRRLRHMRGTLLWLIEQEGQVLYERS